MATYLISVLRVDRSLKNGAWGGAGKVTGIVKINTALVKRKVRLYNSPTGILIREQWARSDGSYLFSGLRTDVRYTVTSTDYSNTYNDVIAANITAI